jgi:hypothetical protein
MCEDIGVIRCARVGGDSLQYSVILDRVEDAILNPVVLASAWVGTRALSSHFPSRSPARLRREFGIPCGEPNAA